MGDAAARPPTPSSACPVCGEGFRAPARRCPRCDTPHHDDCWEYVPGCALFACADTAVEVSTEGWPVAYRLAATRASLMASSAELIHWGTFGAALIVAIGIGVPELRVLFGLQGPALKVAVVVVSLGLLALIAGGLLGLLLLHPRYRSFLDRARVDGDRRLRHAIEERTGGFLAMGPRDATVACLGVLLITILVCQVANGQAFWILRPWWWALVGQALIPAGVVFYGLFWVSARALATQAVLGNRLEATRVAALEKKPDPHEE